MARSWSDEFTAATELDSNVGFVELADVAGAFLPGRRAVADAVYEMSFLAMSPSALKAGAVALALWTVAGFGSVTAQAEEPTAAGVWEKVDASGQPEAWFRIVDCGGTYEGQIVKMFPRPGESDPSQCCTNCQGEQKNAPVLGITFIKGRQRHGLTYENGTILGPRDGSLTARVWS